MISKHRDSSDSACQLSLPVPDWCSLSLPLSFSLTLTHALSLTHTYITDSALTREVQERLTLSHRLFSPRSTLPLPSALHLPLPTATHLSADCDSSPFFNQTPTVTNSTTPIHLPIRSVTKPPPPLPRRTSALPLSSTSPAALPPSCRRHSRISPDRCSASPLSLSTASLARRTASNTFASFRRFQTPSVQTLF